MDRKKLIVVGVLVLLLGSLYFMRNGEPPSPGDHDHDEEQPAPTQPAPSASPAPDGHSEGDGHDHGATPGAPKPTTTVEKDVTKLQIIDIKVGKGKTAKKGDKLVMHYRGKLTNGTVFDESYKRHKPFDVTIGVGQVIPGWDEGIPGMKEGGKRKLIIPSDMGYGAGGTPDGAIPPNSTLIFEVELLKVG